MLHIKIVKGDALQLFGGMNQKPRILIYSQLINDKMYLCNKKDDLFVPNNPV